MPRLGIVIFGCLTKEKYRQQIEDCYNTWVKDAIAEGCLVRFYTDTIPSDLDSELATYCINLNQGDNYISATFKQWRGFEHLFTNELQCDFYYTCGTDTFLNVKAALRELEALNPSHSLYIGGGSSTIRIHDIEYTYFSGGAGIFLSRSALETVLDSLPDFIANWFQFAIEPEYQVQDGKLLIKELRGASDLQIGILCQNQGVQFLSWGANRLVGDGTHEREGVNKEAIIACHHMKHDDFYAYCAYLHHRI